MASWTDNPATSSTHIRTIHINEIRSTVDNDRRAAGIGPYSWTDDPLTTSTHIRAIHFTEIRTAIQQTPGAPTLSDWSVGSPPSSSRQVSARDINDLRGWTDQLSAAVGQQFGPDAMSNQGVVSFSYDPTSGATVAGQPLDWVADAGALKPNGDQLLIRTAIQANQGNNTLGSPGYPEYQAAMDAWHGQGFTVAAVLPREFDRPELNMLCPNGALGEGGNDLLNAYIDDFTLRAEDFARNLAAHNLATFWVWNEPNVHQVNTGDNCPPPAGNTDLSPQVFGAMLVQGCTRIKAGAQRAGYTAITYAGSLSVLEGLTDPNGPLCAGYLDAMYQYLNQKAVYGPYPWDALSLNMENYPDSTFIGQVVSAIQGKQRQYHDTMDGTANTPTKPLLVAEWGVQNSALDPTRARTTYNALRSAFPKAMYFFQHPNLDPNHSSTDYGARDWTIQQGQYAPLSKLTWWDVLYSFYQTP